MILGQNPFRYINSDREWHIASFMPFDIVNGELETLDVEGDDADFVSRFSNDDELFNWYATGGAESSFQYHEDEFYKKISDAMKAIKPKKGNLNTAWLVVEIRHRLKTIADVHSTWVDIDDPNGVGYMISELTEEPFDIHLACDAYYNDDKTAIMLEVNEASYNQETLEREHGVDKQFIIVPLMTAVKIFGDAILFDRDGYIDSVVEWKLVSSIYKTFLNEVYYNNALRTRYGIQPASWSRYYINRSDTTLDDEFIKLYYREMQTMFAAMMSEILTEKAFTHELENLDSYISSEGIKTMKFIYLEFFSQLPHLQGWGL